MLNMVQSAPNQPMQYPQTFPSNHTQYMHPLPPHNHMVANQNAPMPYAMAPRFLHPMVVETSTGHLHLQPFINPDGQIGITPVAPCPPQMQTLPQLQMGMHWNTPAYPTNVPVQEGVPMQQAVYPVQEGMMQQRHFVPAPFNNIQQAHGCMTPLLQTPYANGNITSGPQAPIRCPSPLAQPKVEASIDHSCSKADINGSLHSVNRSDKEHHSKITDSNLSQSYGSQKVSGVTSVEQISNKNLTHHPVSMSTANHFLKSPDSGFGEGHTDAISCASECEVIICYYFKRFILKRNG